MGISIAIDDFGTGYSSLSYLKKIPADILKIDRSFIRDLHLNTDDQQITRAIISMAHHLGLTVVAEGVETTDILDKLKELNCDLAQGYYFSRPMSADEITQQYPWNL